MPNFTNWSSKVRRILWHLSDFLRYGAAFHMLRGELIVHELPDAALLAALCRCSNSNATATATATAAEKPSDGDAGFRCFE